MQPNQKSIQIAVISIEIDYLLSNSNCSFALEENCTEVIESGNDGRRLEYAEFELLTLMVERFMLGNQDLGIPGSDSSMDDVTYLHGLAMSDFQVHQKG